MKTWIKTNLSKITLALALTGATTGTIGLIMGGLLTYQSKNELSFLNYDYTKTSGGGGAIIWSQPMNNQHKIFLYFDIKSRHQGDIKWDGKYPDGYFNK
ncbi:hypothetical protein [Spiroplasma ixodetis]|uniref:hypothetical protein n=1 Tax=Spiroplasma ixodetis TaxID=2141 RepID=UPI0025791E2F|nr:hypothetical protein [Spiroplasma ixodetis]